jgi:hypothetical protein
LTKLLREFPHVRLWRIIFCGSVVKQDFEWEQVRDRFGAPERKTGFIVNDCGNQDIWPVIGKFAGWRYGNAGTDGFGGIYVEDRFHDGGHGLFFDPSFIEQYWKPFVSEGHIVPGRAKQGDGIPPHVRLLSKLPFNLQIDLLIVLVLAVLVFIGVRWWMASPPKANVTLPTFIAEYAKAQSEGEIAVSTFIDRYEGHQVTWDCVILEVKPADRSYKIGSTRKAGRSDQVLAVFNADSDFNSFVSVGISTRIEGVVSITALGPILNGCHLLPKGELEK